MNEQLKALIAEWEGSANLVAEFGSEAEYRIIRVTTKANEITVIRYFTLGNKWVASVDLERGTALEAIKTLARVM